MASASSSLSATDPIFQPPVKKARFEPKTLLSLPPELILDCLKFLPPSDILSASLVNRRLSQLCSHKDLWEALFKRDFPHQPSPSPETARLHYQIYANIRNGRYTTEEYDDPTTAVALPENQAAYHLNPMSFFATHICLFDRANSASMTVPIPDQACFAQWNGKQLAVCCLGQTFMKIWENIDGQFQCRQTLDVDPTNFRWHENQLVTLASENNELCVQIWNPDEKGLLCEHLTHRRPHHDDVNRGFYFAWDGKRLAFSIAGTPETEIWKVSEGKLMFDRSLKVSASFLEWNNHRLFIAGGNEKKCIILNPDNEFSLPNFTSASSFHELYHIDSMAFHGNLLLTSIPGTISCWEPDPKGFLYTEIFGAQHQEQKVTPYVHHHALILQSSPTKYRKLNFDASYRSIFQELADLYDRSTEHPSDLPPHQQRFNSMPKSQKQGIYQEMSKIFFAKCDGSPVQTRDVMHNCYSKEMSAAILNFLSSHTMPIPK